MCIFSGISVIRKYTSLDGSDQIPGQILVIITQHHEQMNNKLNDTIRIVLFYMVAQSARFNPYLHKE